MRIWALFLFFGVLIILYIFILAPAGGFNVKPVVADSELMVGDVLLKMNQSGAALFVYDKSLDMEFDKNTLLKIAKAETNLGRKDEANQIYATLLRKNENETEAEIGKGDIFFDSGNYTGAIPHYDLALSKSPKDAGTWIKRGDSYLALSIIEGKKLSVLYKNLTKSKLDSNGGPDVNQITDIQVEYYQEAINSYQEAIKYAPMDAIPISMRVLSTSGNSLNDTAEIINNL